MRVRLNICGLLSGPNKYFIYIQMQNSKSESHLISTNPSTACENPQSKVTPHAKKTQKKQKIFRVNHHL